MTFGENLRYFRMKQGLTKKELSKMTNISMNTIINYETGKTYPQNRDIYIRLAKALNIDKYLLINECAENQENECNENEKVVSNDSVVACIGKYMPPHIGHKGFLTKLAKEYSKIYVMIGSCYENGNLVHSIPEVEREKMIRAIFKRERIPNEKFEIIPIEDKPTFKEWFDDVQLACKQKGVTHFCTGNKEDILDVLEKNNQTLGLEMINPEVDSEFPYHATDVRKLIIEGKYEEFTKMIPDEIMPTLFRNTFKEIIACSKNKGVKFVPGRQAVDVILLIRNISDGKIYVLLGKRSMKKEDFPGYLALPGGGIDKFETTINAAIREFYEETGLQIELLDNSFEPAIIRFKNVPNSNLEQMHYVGIYSSTDEKVAGTKGGSSQCFGIFVEDELYKYQEYLNPTDDLTNVDFYEINDAINKGLAYQHGEMIRKALTMFEAYPELKKPITSDNDKDSETVVISFVGASGAGKSAAAYGTMYELKKKGISCEYVPEFAKGLFYNGLLGKYIPNQSYIISEQYKQIYDLLGQTDFIITDAGLEISALHASAESKVVEDLAWYLKNKTNTVTIFIERDEEKVPYDAQGRNESEAESRMFGIKLEKYMNDNNSKYIKVKGSEQAVEVAIKLIEKYNANK